METDTVGASHMKTEQSVCFMENAIFTVEVPVSEHNRLEILEAQKKEVQNLEDYERFELVEDVGQECIRSQWVITQKEDHDGQKTKFKARLVAQGFQEIVKPQ